MDGSGLETGSVQIITDLDPNPDTQKIMNIEFIYLTKREPRSLVRQHALVYGNCR
jgi:hypothetical protein